MIDTSALRQAGAGARRWSATMPVLLAGHAPRAASLLLAAARQAAPYKTGQHVRNTLKVRMSHALGGIRLELYGSRIAKWTITGTRPHIITAKGGGVLSFYWPKIGGQAFFRSVHHPGTKPNDWRRRTLTLVRPEMRSLGLQIVRQARTNLAKEMAS